MEVLYPLRFTPIYRRYLWGGRRLATDLSKPLGEGNDYAESWELVDHGQDQSMVTTGPLQGSTLGQLIQARGSELAGRHAPLERFPLLFKLLDAQKTLSVQVHPNDAQAARLDPPDYGKTEAWVVLAAEPESRIYAGLRPGVDRKTLSQAIEQGESETCLHSFQPQPGDCVFLPAGVVHAIGSGLLIAEIQQSSDTTYRLFDWNRVGADGQPRPLHIEAALGVIDFGIGPVVPRTPQPTEQAHVTRLVECDKFVLDRWQFDSPQQTGGDDRFHIVCVLEGSVRIEGDPTGQPLVRGQTMLLPASVGPVNIEPDGSATMLDMYLS